MTPILGNLVRMLFRANHEYPPHKESMFGTREGQKLQSNCDHAWATNRKLLFGYMRVEKRCIRCKTWSARE